MGSSISGGRQASSGEANQLFQPTQGHLLEKNIDKVNWDSLIRNPNAIHLLEKNPDKIDWDWLSYNENAIHLRILNQKSLKFYQRY